MLGADDRPIDRAGLVSIHGELIESTQLAETHVHTRRSDGWWDLERLAEASVARGLAAVVTTDHDDCSVGFAMADYCARRDLPLTVYPGSEISAREGDHDVHVIGVGLRTNVRPWQSVAETVEDILEQDAIPLMPHPKRHGPGGPTFDQILSLEVPVAVEVFNAGVADLSRLRRDADLPELNDEALRFYDDNTHSLMGATGGSDAHFRTIGRGLTGFEGDLLEAIRERRTSVFREPTRERLMPHDVVGYVRGLRKLDRRRSIEWGRRPR